MLVVLSHAFTSSPLSLSHSLLSALSPPFPHLLQLYYTFKLSARLPSKLIRFDGLVLFNLLLKSYKAIKRHLNEIYGRTGLRHHSPPQVLSQPRDKATAQMAALALKNGLYRYPRLMVSETTARYTYCKP